MVYVINNSLNSPLSNKITDSVVALQYADDTAVIAKAELDTLISFKIILRLFASFSGLQVNFAKSIFIPLNIPHADLEWVTTIMGFSRSDFPVTYLGMPLTLKRPTKQHFLPLVEKIEKRLAGWQTKMFSRGGRMILVQAVIFSIPIYHMICFKLPKWVIYRIDKARRIFLWGSSDNGRKGISLCNWEMLCRPKQWGGMGLSDLNLRNISLLLRWWWKGYREPNSMWSIMIYQIRFQGLHNQGPMLWSKQGSFFWSNLISIKHLFNWSTTWIIGDGTCISFWYDHWSPLQPLAATGSRCSNHAWSLRSASQSIILPIELTEGQLDELIWNWSTNGTYSAKSVYHTLVNGGLVSWEFSYTWRFAIPQTVKIFLFLLLKDKLLTRESLTRRNLFCPHTTCPRCNTGAIETAYHLFFQCQHSRSIWGKVLAIIGGTIVLPGGSVTQVWRRSARIYKLDRVLRRKWQCLFASSCWSIWRQRNSVIFEGKGDPDDQVALWIVRQATLWERFCGRGSS